MMDHWGYENEQKPDIVEVVRCRNCVHYEPLGNDSGKCEAFRIVISKNHFCAKGRVTDAEM